MKTSPDLIALDLLPQGVLLAGGNGRVITVNNAARVLLGLDNAAPEAIILASEGRNTSLTDLLCGFLAGDGVRQHIDLEHPQRGWLRGVFTRVDGTIGAPHVHLVVERGHPCDWRRSGRSDPLVAFAHEQRNALATLREGLNLLMEGAVGIVPESQRRFIEGIRADADRMARLTYDMVDATRSRVARMRMNAQSVNVVDLLQELASSYASTAQTADVALSVEDTGAGVWCHADRDLLIQALSNLIGNALKFTPKGGDVHLAARRSADDGGEELVELVVSDSGPGLPPQQVRRIHSRSDGDDHCLEESADEGLGIGLTIVKRIAERAICVVASSAPTAAT